MVCNRPWFYMGYPWPV